MAAACDMVPGKGALGAGDTVGRNGGNGALGLGAALANGREVVDIGMGADADGVIGVNGFVTFVCTGRACGPSPSASPT